MNKKSSAQKRLIEETLTHLNHPTAADVYDLARKRDPKLSLGTVYRNLAAMAVQGELLRLSFADSPDHFDVNTHEHCHAVCNRCGRIFDTDSPLLPELLRQLDFAVERSTGLRVEARSLRFSGICRSCGGSPQ